MIVSVSMEARTTGVACSQKLRHIRGRTGNGLELKSLVFETDQLKSRVDSRIFLLNLCHDGLKIRAGRSEAFISFEIKFKIAAARISAIVRGLGDANIIASTCAWREGRNA